MTKYSAEYWDHRRDHLKHEWRPGDPMPLDQRYALAKLVGYAEGVVASGILSDEGETHLRGIIAEALAAFNLPSKVEREYA